MKQEFCFVIVREIMAQLKFDLSSLYAIDKERDSVKIDRKVAMFPDYNSIKSRCDMSKRYPIKYKGLNI